MLEPVTAPTDALILRMLVTMDALILRMLVTTDA
jgi:hypothetical protein